MDQLILVDSNDREIGYEEKEKCHRPPVLHRAFSIFIFDRDGKMLITQRSPKKVRWGGFWSNAVCSHPRKGEKVEDAVKRRLKEEAGLVCPLAYLFKFEYRAMFDAEWGEHELDHVFFGQTDEKPKPDKDEISDWKFIEVKELMANVKAHPDHYTPWFKIVLERVVKEVGL
jgi:isopentenyl-diphosphate Delta-isomerase